MGAWDELDVEISVDVDTDDVDAAIGLCDEFFTEEIQEALTQIKTGIEEGSKKGVKDLATRNRSFQQQEITDLGKHPYASGMLGSSITEEQQDEYTWLIGTRINHIYPMAVEYGRKAITAPPGKVLWFYSLDGEIVFTRKVGPAEPRPFVEPAKEKTEQLEEKGQIMLRYLGRELTKIEGVNVNF